MNLAPTLMFQWTLGGKLPLGNGASSQMYTTAIDIGNVDQIGLFIATSSTSSGDPNVYIRLAWAGYLPGTQQPTVFVEECIEAPGAVVSGAQRYNLYVKEYGPVAIFPSSRATIWVPTAAHFLKVGCYADAAPSTSAAATVFVELGSTPNAFQQSR